MIALMILLGTTTVQAQERGNYLQNAGDSIITSVKAIPIQALNTDYIADETKEHGFPGTTTSVANNATRPVIKLANGIWDALSNQNTSGNTEDIGAFNEFAESRFIGYLKNAVVYGGIVLVTGGTGVVAIIAATGGFMHSMGVNQERP